MTTRQHSSFAIVFILGLLAMLMPLSIDMYLPALPVISAQFGVPAGSTQMTLSTYILGFALGQLIYGPMADSFGRKPVVLGGTLVFAAAARGSGNLLNLWDQGDAAAARQWADSPIVLWSVDPEDWKDQDVGRIVAGVVEHVQDGDIILMHDLYGSSVDAAVQIVDALLEKGYCFVTVEDLLARNGIEAQDGVIYRSGRK